MPRHVVLLGDSIFDNASYVPEGRAVIDFLRKQLPDDQVTLSAVDGACVCDVYAQPEKLPESTTDLVLSIGGNDALCAAGDLFTSEEATLGVSMERLAGKIEGFAQEYMDLLIHLRLLEKRLTVCTVYDAIPGLKKGEKAGLASFNDIITRTAFRFGCQLIDLRLVCDQAEDYSEVSPIEPSAQGGEKIATAIAEAVNSEARARRVIV